MTVVIVMLVLNRIFGVLEALSSFMKRTDFIPLALNGPDTDWSDVILVRKGSPMIQAVDMAISNSNVAYRRVTLSVYILCQSYLWQTKSQY